MCIGVPCKIISIEGKSAKAEVGGSQVTIRLDLLDQAKVGEYVIVHAGFAIHKLDEQKANETLQQLQQMAKLT